MQQQQLEYIENVQALLNSNPEATSLDIEFQSITDLTPLLSLLSEFKNLKELSFHGNRLKSLPEDMSMLNGLEMLDISNNLISNFGDIIDPLTTIQTLTNLNITIKSAEDQQFLVKNLPQLRYINGQPIPRSNSNNNSQHMQSQQQKNQSYSQQGSQYNNNNSTQQQQQQQQYQGAPNNYHNSSQDELQQQQQQQQNQSFQNQSQNQSVSHDQSVEARDSGNEITLKQEDLETVAILYDQIRELFRETNSGNDKELAEQFDNHVKAIMMDLSLKLKENAKEYIINNNVLKAKFALFEICFGKTIHLLHKVDPRIVQIVQTLHDQHALLFKDMTAQVQYYGQKETEGPAGGSGRQNVGMEVLKQENAELRQQIQNLEEENKKYLDTIIKRTKGDQFNQQQQQQQSSQFDQDMTQQQQQQSQYGANSIFVNGQSPPRDMNQGVLQQSRYQSKMNYSMQNSVVGPAQIRTLTIKQLKDIIEEIYTSKQKYDQKYMEAKLPRETMEQHMYTFLNQKYGLKSLIIEWATAIINGIKKFSQEDNDIAVFGKILRNENDEEFRFVQSQVKNTIAELLKMYLRGRYPFKHNSEIKEMLMQKINGWVFEEEATDIIKYMYSQDDAEQLIQRLKDVYQVHNQKTKEELKKLTREEQLLILQEKEKLKIQYFDFQKIILDFQLKSHEKFLNRFIGLFRTVDVDHNGIIDENEFRQLLELMQESNGEERTQKFLNQVDPYNHQQITFSQCVTLFSSEVVQTSQGQISILQKISLEDQEEEQQQQQ